MGAPRSRTLPHAKRLTITAGCGGGNSPRVHLWKVELQRLADETGLELELCHFPPGTSKWNKVEHRLFSFISLNWRGRPLTSYEVILDLISSTTTSTGLKVYARLDPTVSPKVKVTKEQIEAVNITAHDWHPRMEPPRPGGNGTSGRVRSSGYGYCCSQPLVCGELAGPGGAFYGRARGPVADDCGEAGRDDREN